ncbi:hypothetical protein FHP29_01780 [Nocardioides albidus]|uniref:Uncharacterized protein n=1 Tax=Nocardioides albidus TaxID=1517589 RepID=A0A5C4WJA0_9ACTN|nr:hypothetical protein [Nocardioides albidus]TNM48264.1 hypothetical protein FHP29_01780 [Nocardioides albidus]
MKTLHFVAALGAAVLLPLTVGVPAAHADESFSGTIDGSEPAKIFTEPIVASDQCDPAGDPTLTPVPFDVVEYTSQTTGPRRIVLTGSAEGMSTVEPFAIYAYRNGTCVAADYPTDADTAEVAEVDAGVLDLDNVVFAAGDKVRIEIMSFEVPVAWKVSVLQPGTASSAAPAVGNGSKYTGLSPQIDCAMHASPVTFTKKLAKRVDDVKWVKIKANGATLKKLKGNKLAKVAKKAKKGQPYVVTGIPSATTQLMVQIKFESGKKKTLSRSYSPC